jgi:hypothetical protein
LAEIQNEIQDGANLTQTIGNLTQMIARELQKCREAGRQQANAINIESQGVRGSSHSPLRSALKNNSISCKRDLSESFARTGTDKIEQL